MGAVIEVVEIRFRPADLDKLDHRPPAEWTTAAVTPAGILH